LFSTEPTAELDGIRAIAVLMVLMMHVFMIDDQSSAALLNVVPRALVVLIGHGWLGVDLFFVLSGFLMLSRRALVWVCALIISQRTNCARGIRGPRRRRL